MTESDRKPFADLVTGLAVNFRQEVSLALRQAYWLGLGDLPMESITVAVTRALRECEFMPSVAELRKFAGRGKDVRPYHKPYVDPVSDIERKRIQGSWSAVNRLTPLTEQEDNDFKAMVSALRPKR